MDFSSTVPHPTRAEIDLAAFRHNLDAVRAYVGPSVKVMAVVKANAYGHGAIEMAREAIRHGVEYLAVARAHEALELREAGIVHPLLLLEVVRPEHRGTLLDHDVQLTVVTTEGAGELAASSRRVARIHIKVDTGMGRLGFDYSRAATAVEKISLLRGIEIAGLYSHFATSEAPDQSYARLQIERFRHVVEELERRKIDVGLCHMANSGAIIAHADAHFDMVRPGIMLYGYPPGHGMPEKYPVRPVMALRSIVSFVKTVEPGSSISYGRRYVAHRRTQIATVPVGYADGFSRSLTNRASVIIRGVRYPQVGTVCMDHIMVDTGADGRVREGDPVTLIGSEGDQSITAWDIGETIGTIPYEVTSLISARVPRIFLDKPGSGPG